MWPIFELFLSSHEQSTVIVIMLFFMEDCFSEVEQYYAFPSRNLLKYKDLQDNLK